MRQHILNTYYYPIICQIDLVLGRWKVLTEALLAQQREGVLQSSSFPPRIFEVI